MYENLLSQYSVNQVTTQNRLVMTAMHNYCSKDGIPTEDTLNYFTARAKGGWGMIVTDMIMVTPEADPFKGRSMTLASDDVIPEHKKLTDSVHKYGSKIVAQLSHGGIFAKRASTGLIPVAPSAVQDEQFPDTPRELSKKEIHDIVELYGDSALRAKKAGYDGIEIHGGNRYLIFTFVTPLLNKRTDEYGGNFMGRVRFALEVVKNIREKVGPDFLLIYKMSITDEVPGGQTLAESQVLASLLEEAGVDTICVGQGGSKSRDVWISPYQVPKGSYISNTKAIKDSVSIPVMANGRIVDPEMGELFIKRGFADFIAMGRETLADPEMPLKLKEGRSEEVYHCIGCLQGCIGEMDKGHMIKCMVNPLTNCGLDIEPTDNPKKIWVVGGGIAGTEAAIWAAKRGHEVTLFEKDDKLGGQWRAACVPVNKSDFGEIIRRQALLLAQNNVDVKTGTEISKADIENGKPDIVLLATGSNPILPNIPGLESVPHAFARDVLTGKSDITKIFGEDYHVRNILILGGGSVGAETAEYMGVHDYNVTLIEMKDQLAEDMEVIPRKYLLNGLKEVGVKIFTGTTVTNITDKCVECKSQSNKFIVEDIDLVLVAVGEKANTALISELEDYDGQVIAIGNAKEVADGFTALQDGFYTGVKI